MIPGWIGSDRRRGRFIVKHFGNELAELDLGLFQGFLSGGGGSIVFPPFARDDLGVRREVSRIFELMEHRVKRSRADIVTVSFQLLHHLDPEDRLPDGVVKHVHPHESAEKHFGQQIVHVFRTPISSFNINAEQPSGQGSCEDGSSFVIRRPRYEFGVIDLFSMRSLSSSRHDRKFEKTSSRQPPSFRRAASISFGDFAAEDEHWICVRLAGIA